MARDLHEIAEEIRGMMLSAQAEMHAKIMLMPISPERGELVGYMDRISAFYRRTSDSFIIEFFEFAIATPFLDGEDQAGENVIHMRPIQ